MASSHRLTDEDESAVVALAKLGDKAAFSELVRRNQSSMRNLLRRLSNDPVLADDLSQQVFMAAWIGLKRLRAVEAFQGWLRKLAINTWLKHIRRKDPVGRAGVLDDASAASLKTDVGKAIDLDLALATLPHEARLCIVLGYHEGMSHRAIAGATGLPIGTVKSHISRGSAKLREFLSAYDKGASSTPKGGTSDGSA